MSQKCKGSWDYYEQLYVKKLDNLEEMDTFLESYHQPRQNHWETENLSGLIPTKEIESAIKNLLAKKGPELEGFPNDFYQTFKEKTFIKTFTKMFCKLFRKTKKGETC